MSLTSMQSMTYNNEARQGYKLKITEIGKLWKRVALNLIANKLDYQYISVLIVLVNETIQLNLMSN